MHRNVIYIKIVSFLMKKRGKLQSHFAHLKNTARTHIASFNQNGFARAHRNLRPHIATRNLRSHIASRPLLFSLPKTPLYVISINWIAFNFTCQRGFFVCHNKWISIIFRKLHFYFRISPNIQIHVNGLFLQVFFSRKSLEVRH